jgi:hypothetical protein
MLEKWTFATVVSRPQRIHSDKIDADVEVQMAELSNSDVPHDQRLPTWGANDRKPDIDADFRSAGLQYSGGPNTMAGVKD